MNKKMRELLAQMEEKRKTAEALCSTEKSLEVETVISEIEDLEKQYNLAKKLYENEKNTLIQTMQASRFTKMSRQTVLKSSRK